MARAAGTIPGSMTKLTALKEILLQGNKLTGETHATWHHPVASIGIDRTVYVHINVGSCTGATSRIIPDAGRVFHTSAAGQYLNMARA